jgi:hypothetical protein
VHRWIIRREVDKGVEEILGAVVGGGIRWAEEGNGWLDWWDGETQKKEEP